MGLTLARVLALFLLVPAMTFPAAAQGEGEKELRILRITPEGKDAAAARQIVIEFNRPVVPVGAMERKAEDLGIVITPALNCQWRWLNTTALSCNLGEQDFMARATAYTVTITPKIAAEDGAMMAEEYSHTFTTQRAGIDNAYITTWETPGTPVVRVSFNQPVTKGSIADHVYFETGNNEKTRHAVTVTKAEDDLSEAAIVNGVEARPLWIVKPSSELPLNLFISLKQEAGLVSAEGPEESEAETTVKQFQTFPAFAVNTVQCRDSQGNYIKITQTEPQSPDNLCNPLQPISISFTSPVLRSTIKDHLTVTPDLSGQKKNYNPWGDENRDWSRLSDQRESAETEYTITFPGVFKAAQDYMISLATAKPTFWDWVKSLFVKDTEPKTLLSDEFGRTLAPFSIAFSTGHRNPNYELVHRDAVLEKNIDSDVPAYVNNLDEYTIDYTALTTQGVTGGSTGIVPVPDVMDVQFAMPAGIRDMLGGKSGAVYGFLNTNPYVEKWDGANRLFAQVTPYQIYAKLGHFRSTVWVTDLATGKTVPEANVTIYKGELNNLRPPENALATVTTDENGLALLPGTETLDPDLALNRSYRDQDTRLFVRVEKGEDMALLPLSYDYEVQLWNVAKDVYSITNEQYGHMKSWGMTAQGIYRAGDTMQYKIYVRDQDNERFVAPPSGSYALDISDPAGKSVWAGDVSVNEFGTINGEYTIPKSAAVGWYNFKLDAKLQSGGKDVTRTFYPMSVLVSDFTPAPFRVTTDINGTQFAAGDKLDITASAALHSGGPYGDASVRSTVTLTAKPFTSKHKLAEDFYFNSFEGEMDSEELFQKEDKLNDKGTWQTTFTLPEKEIVFGQLRVENSVRDDRGKSIASESRADYAGVNRLVGLKPTEWVFTSGKPATVDVIVVDDKGTPTKGTKAHVTFEREDVMTAKVKSAGNAYLADNTVTWTKVDDCHITSGEESNPCAFTPETSGTYRAVATIKDTKGREHSTYYTLYVAGSDYVQWNEGSNYALTILPERTDYKVGDTARYLVKNPYPGATAYISIERYGVIDSFVQVLEGSTPVIEIPIKADYLPGVYLSIVAVSPRVESPPVDASQIDLGKPAFRVGYVKIPVIDPYKEMTIVAKADKEKYRPRDKVTVDLEAAPRHGSGTKAPIELAVAVLDESVFDLIMDGRNAFDPYKGFYDLDNLDVTNYSLMTRLIGRQKFEKKGANAGGDGGVDAGMRNMFKFVSYWNPSVPVDENGKAQITFDAPDNLTGWKILAIANTKDDLMGLGEGGFKVNRPTELRPVMPNQVREDDAFSAAFSVMNRTDKPRTITVKIESSGDLDGKDIQTKEESVTLEPYKRGIITMPLKASLLPATGDYPQGSISFRVNAGDDVDSDGVEHTLPVLKSRTFDTAANYATTTEDTASESLAIPKDIYTDGGDLRVTLSPTVVSGLDGAFRYMRDYAYPCWEQKLSMAVMASHYKTLNAYLSTEWEEAQTLPQSMLDLAAEYQAPNGGMAYFKASDDYADPYLSAFTALSFRTLKKAGYIVPVAVEDKLHIYLLGFLRNNAAPSYYSKDMVATVRATILAALADTGKITESDVVRFKDHRASMSLFGKAHYLEAANHFTGTKSLARETLGTILSSGTESGGKISFADNETSGYERILSTPLRDNCAVLGAMLTYGDQDLIGDKPFKMVRYITQSRGSRDHFENTQENLFCMTAIANYAAAYEQDAPDMVVSASVGNAQLGDATFHTVKDASVTLSKPLEESDVGTKTTLSLNREGKGRYYYNTVLRYASKSPADSVNAGMDVKRTYSVRNGKEWSIVTGDATIKRGDLVKVDLYASLPSARNFVVLNDPLPGGLEIVNRDLATSSSVDADAADEGNDAIGFNASRWSFYHRELRHDSARFYADWLESGDYHLSYTAQAVATGTFSAPATFAEEMYDPDVYGRGTKGTLIVEETP